MLAILAQTKTGTSNLVSTVVAFDNNTIPGNSIVVVAGNSSSTAGDISGVTDTQGNVYVKDNATANATVGEIEIWHTSGIIGGANTVTVAYTTGVACAVIIREYYGFLYANSLDKQTGTTGNSNTLSSGNTSTLTQNSELLIGAGLIPLANTFSAAGNFVNLVSAGAPLVVAVAAEDLLVTTGGVQAATFGANASIQWVCVIATFFLLPTGTTTSTSSTSSTSSSTSSTSSSTSSISTSTSSTSASTSSTSSSSTSSSISTSSTSSSTSSTSSSISSTSSSSTSASTSISSTSSSISSTSFSSTSTSSTSSSTSRSSTSSSISSTSASTSSTSFSSTSSSSSTSTTAIELKRTYRYEDDNILNTDNANIDNPFTALQVGNATGDDGDYFIEYGSEYMMRQHKYKHSNNTDSAKFTWKGRSTQSAVISPIFIQVYNVNAAAWETLATNNTTPADTDFSATVSQSSNMSNYYDSNNVITFRSYQQVI